MASIGTLEGEYTNLMGQALASIGVVGGEVGVTCLHLDGHAVHRDRPWRVTTCAVQNLVVGSAAGGRMSQLKRRSVKRSHFCATPRGPAAVQIASPCV